MPLPSSPGRGGEGLPAVPSAYLHRPLPQTPGCGSPKVMSPLLEQSRCWKHLGKSPVQVPLERVPSPLELGEAWAQGGSAPAQWEGKVGRVTVRWPRGSYLRLQGSLLLHQMLLWGPELGASARSFVSCPIGLASWGGTSSAGSASHQAHKFPAWGLVSSAG